MIDSNFFLIYEEPLQFINLGENKLKNVHWILKTDTVMCMIKTCFGHLLIITVVTE